MSVELLGLCTLTCYPLILVQMAVEFLQELEVPFFKVGSGDTNNLPYIKKTAQKGKCLLLLCCILEAHFERPIIVTLLVGGPGAETTTSRLNEGAKVLG